MNRETKRMLQRQGQLEADGSPSTRRNAAQTPRQRPQPTQTRAPLSSRIVEFIREVRSEWRQVAWPTRSEIFNSSLVVLVVLICLVSFIFGLNWLFSHGFLDLFNQ
ncbi:MAG: preprotein translocase subunit SecE [Acidimicrobiales bacterium]